MKAQSQDSTSRGTSRLARLAVTALFVAGSSVPLLSAAIPVSAQSGSVSFSTAELAPADAFAYSVMTLDNRSDQWLLSEELLRRAGFSEAIDQAISEEMTDENGNPLPLDAFMGGEIGVVVDDSALDAAVSESLDSSELGMMTGDMGSDSDDGPTNELQGIAAILDARAPDTAWAGISQSASEDNAEETDYNGTTIIFSEPSAEDDSGMAAARIGDHILLASTPEDLHPLIDTANGENDNITSVPQFATVLDALPTEFMSFTLVNNGVASDVDLGPFESSSSGLVNDSFTGVTLSADQPGFRFETVTVPGEDALPAIPAAYDSSLEAIAPEDALIFLSAPDLGATGVLDALGAALLGVAFGMSNPALTDATPEAPSDPEAAIAQQYEDAAGLLGVNLQTDLFQQFAGEYGMWLTADAAMESGSGVFASEVSDPDTVNNTLMQLSFLIQGAMGGESALATRAVGDGSVYTMDLGDGMAFEFGVVGGMFVIGTSDAIDRFGGADSGTLSGDTLYQDVMATLPKPGIASSSSTWSRRFRWPRRHRSLRKTSGSTPEWASKIPVRPVLTTSQPRRRRTPTMLANQTPSTSIRTSMVRSARTTSPKPARLPRSSQRTPRPVTILRTRWRTRTTPPSRPSRWLATRKMACSTPPAFSTSQSNNTFVPTRE